MPGGPRTFKVGLTKPGKDIGEWQEWCLRKFLHWGVRYPLAVDGVYGPVTRDATASICHGMGLASASKAMEKGVTKELRSKLRNADLTPDELRRHREREKNWLPAFRKRYEGRDVSPPLAKILSSSWGYHPPDHDGVDLICSPRAAGLAICKGRIIRADNSGWWGKGAPSPSVAAKGDGVLVLRCGIDSGPFNPGLNFVYGHAEHVRVKEGDRVEAGQVVCEAGLANAWHFHFCVNDRNDDKGVGDRDPMPFIRYAMEHS